jgi:hypothetical protein
VNIEQARVCSLRALRPHGVRKLTATSRELLMRYAPLKPLSADTNIVQTRPQQAPQRPEVACPYWIENIPPPAQDPLRRPNDYLQNGGRLNTTNLAYAQPPYQYYATNLRTEERREPIRQSLLYPHSQASITPRETKYRYNTFASQSHTSRFPTQPPGSPGPSTSGGGSSCCGICVVIALLGIGAVLYWAFK